MRNQQNQNLNLNLKKNDEQTVFNPKIKQYLDSQDGQTEKWKDQTNISSEDQFLLVRTQAPDIKTKVNQDQINGRNANVDNFNNLAKDQYKTNNYDKVFELYKAFSQQFLEEKHYSIAISYNIVGNCYFELKQYKDALEFFLKSLEMKKVIYQEDHPSFIIAFDFVANCYFQLNEYRQALEYYKKSLKQNQLMKENALKLYLESLEDYEQIYKEKDHCISISMSKIGDCFFQLELYKNGLEIYLKSLAQSKLIQEYQLQYYLKFIEQNKLIFNINHPSLPISLNLIGDCYFEHGQQENAQKFYLKSQQNELLFQENHPSKAISENLIGSCYFDHENFEKALEFYQKSLERAKSTLKENHIIIARSHDLVGHCYHQLKQYEMAKQSYKKTYEMNKINFKRNDCSITISLNNVMTCYYELDQMEEAISFYFEQLEIIVFEGNHSSVANTLSTIGLCYFKNEIYDEALKYFFKSLDQKPNLHDNQFKISNILNDILNCYYLLGEYQLAQNYQSQSDQFQQYQQNINNYNHHHHYFYDHNNQLENNEESVQEINNLKIVQENNQIGRIQSFENIAHNLNIIWISGELD